MKAYLISLTSAVVFASLTDILLPQNMKKYVSLITGAMILICLISPLAKITDSTLVSFMIPEQDYIDYTLNDVLIAEFKKNVEKDISERILTEFKMSVKANISVKMSADKISGVDKITLFCKQNTMIKDRLSFIYGCDLIEFSDGG